MMTKLSDAVRTQRVWNGRDDISQHYFGRIPSAEKIVTLTLTWKMDKKSSSKLIGMFRFEMEKLLKAGYVRVVPGWYILRFQRTGDQIEIATKRSGNALPIGNYKP